MLPEDLRPMNYDPAFAPDDEGTATGILLCLRMLAEEATALRLESTLAALNQAIRVCEAEHTEQVLPGEAIIVEASANRVMH